MKNKKNIYILSSILLCVVSLFSSCKDVEYPERSNKCEMGQIYLNVKVPQIDPAKTVYQAIYGTVNDGDNKIYFDVPYTLSESLDDVTDLSEVFVVASVPVSSTITPGLGGLKDLTTPMDIKITAANGMIKEYTLEARLKKSNEKSILSFEFEIDGNTFSGIPNEETHTVSYIVSTPELQDLIAANKAVPTFELSSRATITSPDITQPLDFSKDIVVTVEAQDGTTQEWTIVQAEPQMLDYGFGYTRKKWFLSADNMGFGGSLDYRGMTVTADYVVISARNFSCLLFDKETGAAKGKVTLPSDLPSAYGSMYITADESGKLVAGSFSSWTGGKFLLYYWKDGENAIPVRVIDKAGLGDTGRKFAVIGDLSKNAFVYVTKGKGNAVYRFTIENGICTKDETITVTEPNSTFTYLCTPVPLGNTAESQFILVDQQATGAGSVSLHNANGKMVAAMTDGAKCMSGGVTADGKCFTFNNATYLMYIDQNSTATSGRIRIYDITKLDNFTMAATNPLFSTFKVFESDLMTSTGNGNGTGAVAYDFEPDGSKAYVYMMFTNGGVMKYELTKIAL